MRPTAEKTIEEFKNSGKKHLIITGSKRVGKTTLFNKIIEIMAGSSQGFPGLTSKAIPKKHVVLQENITGNTGIVGIYCPEKAEPGRTMIPASDGFFTVGVPALEKALKSSSQWISMDELGFLESHEESFQKIVRKVFDEKNVVAVIRKQPDVPFLVDLTNRKDIFIMDLDAYDLTE